MIVAVAALMVALGGVAWASIPDPGGVIHGCYAKSTGALRVVDTSKPTGVCSEKQVPISWNQTGPQGVPGPAGPEYLATGIVEENGTLVETSASPGVTVTVSHPSAGVYDLSYSGLGAGCPVPSYAAGGQGRTVSWSQLFCDDNNGGVGSEEVVSGDGADINFTYQIVGVPSSPTSSSSAARRPLILRAGR